MKTTVTALSVMLTQASNVFNHELPAHIRRPDLYEPHDGLLGDSRHGKTLQEAGLRPKLKKY